MPTSADAWACDTSVAVAALDEAHEAHEPCRAICRRHRPALAGHAAFETYSVLTRLPGLARVDPEVASAAIAGAFGDRCFLDRAQQSRLLARLGGLGLQGGMVYDALVGEAARLADRTLLTRDRRAIRVYDLLGVTYRFVD